MLSTLRRRPFLSLSAALVAMACAGGAWYWWLMRGIGQAVAGITPETVRKFAEPIRQELELVNEKKAWLTADTRSVGFPDREEKLLELNDNFGVAWFVGTFRRPPVTLYELPELFQPWPELNTREIRQLYTEYARDCDIMEFLDDSYVLNCDGWKPENFKSSFEMEKGFETGVERFYRFGDHVLLYVPSQAQAEAYAKKHPIRVDFGPQAGPVEQHGPPQKR